jgi:hypothetical protein
MFRSKMFEMYCGIFRGFPATRNMFYDGRFSLLIFWLTGEHLNHNTKLGYNKTHVSSVNRISRQPYRWISESFIIYNGMWEFGKFRSTSGNASTKRAEKIFPKYLLYYFYEIAWKYLREKKYSSSFYDSALTVNVWQSWPPASLCIDSVDGK